MIIGTAGHVDHGKTMLIKALTGVDADRLKEEKERGMTIDLGFAPLVLPNGQRVGIVDVPGHERFIKNMLAGAGGVDVALLVIAADESVMPQTIEHLEILELLEVRHGVVAITKSDLVDDEMADLVEEDIQGRLSGSPMADAPIVRVSAVTGEGIEELRTALQKACESMEETDISGGFRVPIDRVFTMTGFGTVVTGTLVSGTVKVGDALEVMPAGLQSRIRQLHVFGKKVESASARARLAINLAGLEIEDLRRGDVCCTPGMLKASRIMDLRVNLLKDAARPLKNGTRVRFHSGTAETLGRVTLLDRDELEPGAQCFAQIRTESPAAVLRGDRFVIRAYSPMVTIGGGVVVDPVARRRPRFDEAVLASLETRSKGTPEERAEQMIRQAETGIAALEIEKAVPESERLLASLRAKGHIVELEGGRIVHVSTAVSIEERARDAISRFHAEHPLKPGMPKEALRASIAKGMDSRSFSSLVSWMAGQKTVRVSDALVALPDFEVRLSPSQQQSAERVTSILRQARFNVPTEKELLAESGVHGSEGRDVLDVLASRGEIVKVADDLYFHGSTITDAERALREEIGNAGSITVSRFRDLTGSSRKYAVPLLEYFDSKRVTRRVGDSRVLAQSR